MIIKDCYIKNKKGFSLIELMVVIAILGFIVLGLVTFFTGGTKSWVAGQSQLTAQRNARQAMDYMVRELRHAERIIHISNGEKEHRIKVSIPNLNGTGGSGYLVEYSWSGTPHDPVYRKTMPVGPGGIKNILIDDVLNLKFTSPPESFRIDILLEIDVDHDGHADISLNTAVNLRNFGL